MICYSGVIGATLVMACMVAFPYPIVMWIAAGGFGLYIGPLWTSLWTYLGEYIIISGKASTLITVGSGFVIISFIIHYHLCLCI